MPHDHNPETCEPCLHLERLENAPKEELLEYVLSVEEDLDYYKMVILPIVKQASRVLGDVAKLVHHMERLAEDDKRHGDLQGLVSREWYTDILQRTLDGEIDWDKVKLPSDLQEEEVS